MCDVCAIYPDVRLMAKIAHASRTYLQHSLLVMCVFSTAIITKDTEVKGMDGNKDLSRIIGCLILLLVIYQNLESEY